MKPIFDSITDFHQQFSQIKAEYGIPLTSIERLNSDRLHVARMFVCVQANMQSATVAPWASRLIQLHAQIESLVEAPRCGQILTVLRRSDDRLMGSQLQDYYNRYQPSSRDRRC